MSIEVANSKDGLFKALTEDDELLSSVFGDNKPPHLDSTIIQELKEYFASAQTLKDNGNLPDDFFDEEDSEDELIEGMVGEDEDIMLPESGPSEERMKNSRQFRANLDALFRSVYE